MKTLRIMALIAATLGTLAFATDPCPGGNGRNMGLTIQRECRDDPGYCSFTLWNYWYTRPCYWWCCYDAQGHLTGSLLTDCGPWDIQLNQCCSSLGAEQPPACPSEPPP